MVSEVEQLRVAITALQELDLDAWSDDELAEVLVEVDRQFARLEGTHARLAAAADARQVYAEDRSRSAAAWLGRKCRRSKAAAGRAVRLGRGLRAMQLTDEALAAGEIAPDHARELLRCRQTDSDSFDAYEAKLVEFAATLRWDDFVQACAYWRQAVDPDGAEVDADRQFERRFCRWTKLTDGSIYGEFRLDALGGAAFVEGLERIEDDLFRADWAAAKADLGDNIKASDLERSHRQRRADALVEMAYRAHAAPAGGRRPEPLVSIYIDYETLAGRLCGLADGTVVTPGQVEGLLGLAEFERIVFGPANRVIELSERARFFTGGLRRAIQLRDRHCQWPGCDIPATRCDVDHTIPHAAGGPTTQDNGRVLCGAHNRDRHRQRERPPAA